MKRASKSSPENARELILYSAKLEFAEKGYDGARMGDIAKRAKAPQSLIHYHFQSKEKLYVEVLHRGFGFNLVEEFRNFLENIECTPDIKLLISIYMCVNIPIRVLDHDFIRISIREQADNRESTRKIIREYATLHYRIVEDLIKNGVKAGYFSPQNTLFSIMAIKSFSFEYANNRALMKGTPYFNKLYGKGYKPNEVFKFLADAIFKALSPEKEKAKTPGLPTEIKNKIDKHLMDIKEKLKWKIDGI